jgi:hypothetical protein
MSGNMLGVEWVRCTNPKIERLLETSRMGFVDIRQAVKLRCQCFCSEQTELLVHIDESYKIIDTERGVLRKSAVTIPDCVFAA